MLITHKRARVAAALEAARLLDVIERLAGRRALRVIAYHRVCEPCRDGSYLPLVSATPEAFRIQIEQLARRYALIDLEALLQSIDDAGRLRLERPSVLVTFDDGYRDNLTVAAPIAHELGIRPVLFATTGFVDGTTLPWWERGARIVAQTLNSRLDIDRPESLSVEVAEDRTKAVRELVAVFIRCGWTADESHLAHLAERAGVDLRAVDRDVRSMFVTREGLEELARLGWSIGAHTQTHRRLAALPEADQELELRGPRDQLQQVVGREVVALAYPFGGPDSLLDRTKQLARMSGYRIAFTLQAGVVRAGPLDTLAVPRFAVGPDDSPALLRLRLALGRRSPRDYRG